MRAPKLSKKPFPRDGVWHFGINYTDPKTGRRKHTARSTNETVRDKALTKREDILDEFRIQLAESQVERTDRQAIGKYFAEYERTKLRDLRPATQRDYLCYIRRFEDFFDRDTSLCNITRQACQEWLASIAKAPARRKAYSTLRAVLEEALKNEKLQHNPFASIAKPKVSGKKADYFDNDRSEFVRFFEQMPSTTYRLRTIKNMSYLAQATGMRSGEVAHLRVSDVDKHNVQIQVRNSEGFETKNGRERSLLLSPQADDAIRLQMQNKVQHRAECVRESPYLFPNEKGTPYSANAISNNFREVREAILPLRTGLHFHSLRHTFAQNASNNSVPITQIAEALGDGIGVTEATYAPMHRYRRASTTFQRIEEYLLSLQVLTRPQFNAPISSASGESIRRAIELTDEAVCTEASA